MYKTFLQMFCKRFTLVTCTIKHWNIFANVLQMFYFTCNHSLTPAFIKMYRVGQNFTLPSNLKFSSPSPEKFFLCATVQWVAWWSLGLLGHSYRVASRGGSTLGQRHFPPRFTCCPPPTDSKASWPFWRDFWGPKMLQNQNFPGLRPGPRCRGSLQH